MRAATLTERGFVVSSIPELVACITFLVFAVKLPMFGLHYWLPVAHVEAPTCGSIVLAGVLLKLGGVGLLRLSFLLSSDILSQFLLGYLLVFTLFSGLVCCYQQDFKRLVAYSSVFHIMMVPMLLLGFYGFSNKVILILMFTHGVRSPVLFGLVGVLYSLISSRQLVVFRGLLGVSPFLSFLALYIFFINISAPPFPGFLAEVLSFICCYNLSSVVILFFILLPLVNLLYSLNWFSAVSIDASLNAATSVYLSFRAMLPLAILILAFMATLLLIYFF